MVHSAAPKQQFNLQGHQLSAPGGTSKLNAASTAVARHHAHHQ